MEGDVNVRLIQSNQVINSKKVPSPVRLIHNISNSSSQVTTPSLFDLHEIYNISCIFVKKIKMTYIIMYL